MLAAAPFAPALGVYEEQLVVGVTPGCAVMTVAGPSVTAGANPKVSELMLHSGLWSPSAGCVWAKGDILHWNVSGLIIWIRTARMASECCQSESSEQRGQRWDGR